jgi:mycothiol synthase
MVHVRVLRALGPEDRAEVEGFLLRAHATDGTMLNDHLRTDLANGPRDGFVGALAVDDHGGVVGYAQASVSNSGFVVDCIVGPHAEHRRGTLLAGLVHELPGDAAITWWTHDGDHDAAALAASLGMHAGRTLLQMRCPLPPAATTDVATRPFVVGADETAWLDVNNAAFAWHGEQGGWDLVTLEQRELEPWFRADGFLLHERDGRLAAFCWTKLHLPPTPTDATIGEIYVIAVHPDYHGIGLGKALTLAGLTWLHHAGATEGMLYVDAQNTGAVAMYVALGFHITHTDQAYARPSGGTDS